MFFYSVLRYLDIMHIDDVSADSLLNMILDKVDDMIVINDPDKNIIWMNCSAERRLNITNEKAVGMKCYRLLGATCCCDSCTANLTMGGPRRQGCIFKCTHLMGEYECDPVPYFKEGKLKIVVQHIRLVQQK